MNGRSLWAAGAALALAAAAAPQEATARVQAGEAASVRSHRWLWTHAASAGQRLSIDLVRGTVRVVRRPGDLRVEMQVRSTLADPRSVTFAVNHTTEGIAISDRYPPRSALAAADECLPPVGDRGDFWTSDARIEAVVYAPPGLQVSVDIMECRGDMGGRGWCIPDHLRRMS